MVEDINSKSKIRFAAERNRKAENLKGTNLIGQFVDIKILKEVRFSHGKVMSDKTFADDVITKLKQNTLTANFGV